MSYADPARLMQCVVNVLTNACKYTDPGGQITVQLRAEGECALIEISDTGVGIPAELLPRIFDLFVQGDRSPDRSQGGLGVGLAVVRRLLRCMPAACGRAATDSSRARPSKSSCR
jgi:signal transduction histidine kinase